MQKILKFKNRNLDSWSEIIDVGSNAIQLQVSTNINCLNKFSSKGHAVKSIYYMLLNTKTYPKNGRFD